MPAEGQVPSLSRGVYILALELHRGVSISVGRLGNFRFPAGYYLYVGSAMGGFAGRINRHLKRKKRLHWHIDYLLEKADFLWVDMFEALAREDECRLNSLVAGLPGAKVVSPGFGTSGCRCRTHLHYFETLPALRLTL